MPADKLTGLAEYAEELAAEDCDQHLFYVCPICGLDNDEYTSCGCYEDIHYGSD